MFVDREWLKQRFEAGASQEEIGRELGLHGTTIAYWARKHGLSPAATERYSPRGAPDRAVLAALAANGATLREMAVAIDRSIATVRYWLARWGIERTRRSARVDPASAPRKIERTCARHGETTFHLEGRGYYRCSRCRQEHVSARRRRVKALLVAEAGGKCAACGYDACQAALEFHHRDPALKEFALSAEGVTRGIERARAEARKCVLLCANCHAEVGCGHRVLEEVRAA
jgi:DNA-binding CsgD family transcriptional regulator